MSVGFKGGGSGGAALNYSVKCCVTKAALPQTARENTIMVISKLGYISGHTFNATAPNNPEHGMVWFKTGTASSIAFSATKKNPIVIYPISASQCFNGAWAKVEAVTYQNGQWVEWLRYLLSADGFAKELGSMNSYGESGVNISTTLMAGGGVLVKRTSTNQGYVALCSENTINVAEYKTMRIKTGAVDSSYVEVGFSRVNNSPSAATSNKVVAATLTPNSEVTINLSDVNGEYYLAVMMSFVGIPMSAEILEIALEY